MYFIFEQLIWNDYFLLMISRETAWFFEDLLLLALTHGQNDHKYVVATSFYLNQSEAPPGVHQTMNPL